MPRVLTESCFIGIVAFDLEVWLNSVVIYIRAVWRNVMRSCNSQHSAFWQRVILLDYGLTVAGGTEYGSAVIVFEFLFRICQVTSRFNSSETLAVCVLVLCVLGWALVGRASPALLA